MRKAALRTAFIAACLFSAVMPAAFAQTFPAKPITLICPWNPGGSTDLHMRAYAQIAAKYLGQPVIIENRPGASGLLGPTTMAKTAQADGYTLAQLPVSAFRVPHMQKVDWDPLKDFTYIIGITGYTFGVVVKADSPIKTLKDMIDYAKANPGNLSYGSTGNGTSPHLLMEELGLKTGVTFLHDAFRKALDDPEHLKVLTQLDQVYWYKSSEDYARWAAETLRAERATIERVGLLAK